MRIQKLVLVLLTALAVCVLAAVAEVPKVMTFQGKLVDSQGHYLDGTQALTFRIYDRETGGAVLWQEQHSDVPATRGIFAVPLGVYQPLSLPFDTNYWISVQVAGDAEMAPRQRLTSAPYAFRAGVADQASYAPVSGVASSATHAATADLATRTLEGGNPPGTVLAFAGANIPAGYLECDGRALASLTYPNLFSAIATAWGTGDGTLDEQGRVKDFNLPDLRGRFLRGKDGTAGRDPDSGTRTASNTGGRTGNEVGSVQQDLYALHGHPITWTGYVTKQVYPPGDAHYGTVMYPDSCAPFPPVTTDFLYWYLVTNTLPEEVYGAGAKGGTETRPKNAYVMYVIKY